MSCINSDQEGLNPENQQKDDAILMSFLEDTVQVECCDDERLITVIQSLEAAINPILINDHGSLNDSCQLQDCIFDQLLSTDEERMSDDQDNFASHDLDFGWMDVEMSASSSPSDQGISCWYELVGEDDVGYNIAQYGGVIDYSEIPLEDHIYSYIWQETYGL